MFSLILIKTSVMKLLSLAFLPFKSNLLYLTYFAMSVISITSRLLVFTLLYSIIERRSYLRSRSKDEYEDSHSKKEKKHKRDRSNDDHEKSSKKKRRSRSADHHDDYHRYISYSMELV